MFVVTASRVVNKKQNLILSAPQSLLITMDATLALFQNIRQTGVTDTKFDQNTYVSDGDTGTAKDKWDVVLIIEITDTDVNTPKKMIIPAVLDVSTAQTAATVYTQLNTAFKAHQDDILTPYDLSASQVFVKTIIVTA